ncbi:polyprenyl synthetase family protein [Treponema sp.]
MTDFWNAFPGIPEELAQVYSTLTLTAKSENSIINDAISKLFSGDGKLLRPGLLLIASRFGKIQKEKLYSLAAAVEMLHVATLVHDDVIDDSPLRRGSPAAHVRFGKKDAVLIGDYLLSRCFLLAAAYTSTENAKLLARSISAMCSMEIEQDADRYQADPSIRRYLHKIMGKTALLFSLSAHIGGAEAGARKATTEHLRRAGYDIGMAFQIIDDILDYEGLAGEVRKPIGNDVRAGIATLPLLCALSKDADGRLSSLVSPENFPHSDPLLIIQATKERGGIDTARTYAQRYTNRALKEIAGLPAGENRAMMELLAKKLLERRY